MEVKKRLKELYKKYDEACNKNHELIREYQTGKLSREEYIRAMQEINDLKFRIKEVIKDEERKMVFYIEDNMEIIFNRRGYGKMYEEEGIKFKSYVYKVRERYKPKLSLEYSLYKYDNPPKKIIMKVIGVDY